LEDRSGVTGVHEAISIALIRTDPELRAALGGDICDKAAQLIEDGGTGKRSLLSDIVSGPTDADKLDYLLRDSHYAGVTYGRYDLRRIIATATSIRIDEHESYLGFWEGGVWAVEQLLLARHHMHRQVYGHKTRIATDIMIERALALGIAEGILPAEAYTVPVSDGKPAPSKDFLEAYSSQTDGEVIHALLHQDGDAPSRDLARRLRERDLLRRSARVALHEHRGDLGIRLSRILDRQRVKERTPELEATIAEEISCPAYLVALRIEPASNPTYRLPGSEINAKDIMLRYEGREPDTFERESEIFRDEMAGQKSFASLYLPKRDDIDDTRARELLWTALTSI
jgi:HD superfamily phosphohydrolase